MKRLLPLATLLMCCTVYPAFSAAESEPEVTEQEEVTSLYVRETSVIEAVPRDEYQPWQMLRKIQRTQDEIVIGQADAIETYRLQLQLAAAQMMQLDTEVWQFERNLDAAAIYILIGGDIELGYKALQETKVELPSKILLQAAVAYSERDVRAADRLFEQIDHTVLPPSMSAQVALAKSMVLASADLEGAALYLSDARRFAPGTLVEEAAIRRSARIAALVKDKTAISQLLKTYIFRFANSYYFNDFLRNISFALVSVQNESGMNVVPEFEFLLDKITQPRRLAVGEYAMRQAVIDGRFQFVDWLGQQVIADAKAGSKVHSRLRLYHLAARVAGKKEPELALAEIETIPVKHLSGPDREILEAATKTGLTVTSENMFQDLPLSEDSEESSAKMYSEEISEVEDSVLSNQESRFETQLEEMNKLLGNQ